MICYNPKSKRNLSFIREFDAGDTFLYDGVPYICIQIPGPEGGLYMVNLETGVAENFYNDTQVYWADFEIKERE